MKTFAAPGFSGTAAVLFFVAILAVSSLEDSEEKNGVFIPNSRPTRSLTIEVAREFFYSQQIQQITVSFGHGTNDESVCRTVLSCLYAA